VDDDALAIQAWNLAHARFQNLNDRFSFSNRLPAFLARLRCPLLLAYGENDRTPYPSRDARVAICRAAAPHLVCEVIPEAGHWVQFERPDRTNALIERFLADESSDLPGTSTPMAANHDL
jgi:pimeloyl-ACP methyl ester carboxylesterase